MGFTRHSGHTALTIRGLHAPLFLVLSAAYSAACLANEYPPPEPQGGTNSSPIAQIQQATPPAPISSTPVQFRNPATNPLDVPLEIEQSAPKTATPVTNENAAITPSIPRPDNRRTTAIQPAPPATPAWPPALRYPAPVYRHPPPVFGNRRPGPPGRAPAPLAPVPGFRALPPAYPATSYRTTPAESTARSKPEPKVTEAPQTEPQLEASQAPTKEPSEKVSPDSNDIERQDPATVLDAPETPGEIEDNGLGQFRPPELEGSR